MCVDPLLDHLIRAQQQQLRDSNAECLCGLQVDHQLELGRLLDGKIRRLGALQYLEAPSPSAARRGRAARQEARPQQRP